MSSFPVTDSDTVGIMNAVNYLLSGPAGLGQNFEGFSNYNTGYLSGNNRPPFSTLEYTYTCTGVIGESTIIAGDNKGLIVGMRVGGHGITVGTTIVSIGTLTTDGSIIAISNPVIDTINNVLNFRFVNHPWLYQTPISISTAEMLDERTFKYTFATPYTPSIDGTKDTPFYIGQPIMVSGVTNNVYNITFTEIGVVECTVNYVIARTQNIYTMQSISSGGTVELRTTTLPTDSNPAKYNFIHTDCNGIATVNNGTDRVFIAAQLTNTLTTESEAFTNITAYSVFINRYSLTLSNDINNPSYIVTYDKTLTGKLRFFTESFGTNDTQEYETVFTTVIDSPGIGYYWYFIDIAFNTTQGDLVVTNSKLGLRSLTTQVVKQ